VRRRRDGGPAPAVARDGDKVIDGRVSARLLGLHLLELEAHVVVATARARPATASPAPSPGAGGAREGRLPPATDGARPHALSRAVRLLGEGSSALDDARRIHRRALDAGPARRATQRG
jgi:hypothetical protein